MAQNLELALRIRSQMQEALRDLDRLEKELEGVGDEGKRAGGGLGSMAGQARGLRNAIAGLGVAALVRSLVQVNTQAQSSQAVIRTLTGNVGEAAAVWQELLGFASETPFTLDQSVNAFKALKARGLDPGIDALRAYADFAAAMGRDLTQFVEAVADAATGEFERLKEFGVIARQEGNQVAFTFQGVTTTVQKNAQAIEQYLQGIAQSNFGGAAAAQMETLGGQTSNLQDNFTKLGLAIGEAGANRAFADLLGVMSSGVETLTEHIDELAPIVAVVASALAGRLAQGAAASAAQMLAAGSAAGALRAAMALLGGPAGIVAIVAGGLIGYIATLENTEEKTKRLAGETDKLRVGLEKLSKLQAQNRYNQVQAQIEETTAALVKQAGVIEALERQRDLNAANPAAFAFDPAGLTAARAAEEDLQRVLRDQINTRRDLQAVIDGTFQAEQKAAAGSVGGTKTVNEEYEKLLASLREQAETMGLVGEAARVRYAIEQGALGELDAAQRANLLRYAEQIDAQQRGAEAAKEAAQAARQAAAEQARAAEQQRAYVADLERQADVLGLNADQVRAYEIAERGLTGALRARAEAAAAVIAADEQRRQADADAAEIADLRIQQLRAEGRAEEALAAEIEQRYGELAERLRARGDVAGVQIIDALLNTERARIRLEAIQREVDQVLGEQSRAEQSVQTQQQAGLLSEMAARERILQIHQATQARLEQLRPVLAELAAMPGQIGESASAALASLDAQAERLNATTTLLGETLRDGLETGLTSALQGLARGTLDLRSAIDELVLSVADALLELSAQTIAQSITGGLAGLFGGGAQGGAQAAAITAAGATAATAMAAGVTSGGSSAALQMNQAIISAGTIAAQAISTASAATAGVGAIPGLASGGHVLGPGTATSDSIRAWLSNNEFVTRAAVVTQPGALDFLHDFNRRGMAALSDWTAVHHATGGLAGVPAPSFPAPALDTTELMQPGPAGVENNFRFVNVFDVEDVSRRVAATSTFEKQVLNIVGNNPTAVRERLGV